MNNNILRQFRHDVYDCFLGAKDALFNTVDALMTETQARSLPELTQSHCFERQWSSVYEAFEDGRIDQTHLQEVFAQYVPHPQVGKPLWIGIDASSIARPRAVTSADRTAQHVHNLPKKSKAVTYGWQFSTVVVLPEEPSSWTYVLSQLSDLPNRYQHRTWNTSLSAHIVPEWLCPFTEALEARLSHHQLCSGTLLGKNELS